MARKIDKENEDKLKKYLKNVQFKSDKPIDKRNSRKPITSKKILGPDGGLGG